MTAEAAVERPAYDLAAFCERTGQLLVAQNRGAGADGGTAGLVYLKQGEATQQRPYAREHLRCPFPGCPTPEITTVSRSRAGRRDGYRHLRRGVAHEPESMLHLQAKAMLARWAAGLDEVTSVEQEARVGEGERVADVLMTSRSGNRLAVEIQYAGITVDEWEERTLSYRSLGIAVTWLWGNTGANRPLSKRVRDVHRESLRRGMPVLWINPGDETIAWSVSRLTSAAGRAPLAGDETTHDVEFGIPDDLDRRRSGLFPPDWFPALRRVEEREAQQAVEAELERAQREKARLASQAAAAERARNRLARSPEERSGGAAMPRHCRRCGYRLPVEWILAGITEHGPDCDRDV